MKIYLASDHAGFEEKQHILSFLQQNGYEVEDCGTYEYNKEDDYPDFIGIAAKKVAENPGSFGIVLGKSGAGECIVANKIRGVRAFLAVNQQNVRLAREHNDANVMSIGTDFLNLEQASPLVMLFLKTPFSHEERHVRRLQKIKQIEDEQHP
jgi:ribose 5-phosphate isomerase B